MKTCPNCGISHQDSVIQCDCKYLFPDNSGINYEKYSEFGGWLRFFVVWFWIRTAIGLLCAVIFGAALFMSRNPLKLVENNLWLAESCSQFVFSLFILKIIKVKEPQTISNIKAYIKYGLYVSLAALTGVIIIDIIMKRNGLWFHIGNLFGVVVWVYYIIKYFETSRRSNYYYRNIKTGKD